MEVYHDGEWGTVCDDGWNLNDAQIVCSELGLGRAIYVRGNGFYGQGSGLILSGNLYCYGYQQTIEHCVIKSHRSFICDHEQDAGVKCSTGCSAIKSKHCKLLYVISQTKTSIVCISNFAHLVSY